LGIYNLLLLATPLPWRHCNPRQVTTNTSDLTAKTTQISVINSIQGGHTTSIGNNYNEIFRLNGVSLNHTTLLAGLRTDVDSGSGSQAAIAALQSDVSTINTTLTLHDARISELMILFVGLGGGLNTLVIRLNAVEAGVSTINTTLTAHDSRIFTNTTDIFQLQTNGHEGRITSAEATVTTLRADVDANTLSNTQFLAALQYQSGTIFAIDTAIQGLNGQVGVLETTQITQDNLLREFDQEFNDPATGVIFKLDTLTTTYNTHIDGAFLTIRQNVDSNNLILGTLSTQTTSLLTAMTQVVPRVDTLEGRADDAVTNFGVLFSAISALGATAGSNTTRLEDLEERIEDLEAAP
jgi:hypothetical protein